MSLLRLLHITSLSFFVSDLKYQMKVLPVEQHHPYSGFQAWRVELTPQQGGHYTKYCTELAWFVK